MSGSVSGCGRGAKTPCHDGGTVTDLIDRLEALLAQRAPLWALYGPGGTFEYTRKILLCTCRDSWRVTKLGNNEKVTESQLDDLGHADEEYRRLIARATGEREELARLDAEITGLEHRISLARARVCENAQLAKMQ